MSNRGNGSGSIFKRRDAGPWYIAWYDASGTRKIHCTKTTDKATAQRILADKLANVALRREGIIDPRQESLITEAGKPIETHLADFEAMMKARQRSECHVKRTLLFIREVCTAAKFEKPSDITADGMNRIMAAMKAEGKAPRTIQGRVVACKAFTRWLADHAKLSHDPLRSVKRPSVKTDRRLRRRMLTPAEWPYVRAATLTSGPRDGMNPLERVALYAVAIQTGLRSAELRSLTKSDLFLAGETPYVRCRAQNTKNEQEARQYIQPDLATELRRIVATKTPTAPVFNMPNEWNVADMLRADLAAARRQWLDEVKHDPDARAKQEESDFLAVGNNDGEKLDFHSLRHTCGSWLALRGVQPNVIKTVMRHSTITLTMDTYGHLLPDQHAHAVGGMGDMFSEKTPMAATGTTGNKGNYPTAPGAAPGMRNDTPDGASGCDAVPNEGDCVAQREERKPLRIADVREAVRENATSRGRIRTGTGVTPQGILSPQCLPFHHAARLDRGNFPRSLLPQTVLNPSDCGDFRQSTSRCRRMRFRLT
jgi:integrase